MNGDIKYGILRYKMIIDNHYIYKNKLIVSTYGLKEKADKYLSLVYNNLGLKIDDIEVTELTKEEFDKLDKYTDLM